MQMKGFLKSMQNIVVLYDFFILSNLFLYFSSFYEILSSLPKLKTKVCLMTFFQLSTITFIKDVLIKEKICNVVNFNMKLRKTLREIVS